ncbi:(Fe-S)-binding protein [Thermosulfuriphilus sp.]
MRSLKERSWKLLKTGPCQVDSKLLRAEIALDEPYVSLLPYLNALIPGAVFDPDIPSLIFNFEGSLVSLLPEEIRMAQVKDEETIERAMGFLLEKIAYVKANRERISPSKTRGYELSTVEVIRLLPGPIGGRYCRACGYPSCMAFAARLTQRAERLSRCRPLFEKPYLDKKQTLVGLLKEAGYESCL